jgi:hypothetical protein
MLSYFFSKALTFCIRAYCIKTAFIKNEAHFEGQLCYLGSVPKSKVTEPVETFSL